MDKTQRLLSIIHDMEIAMKNESARQEEREKIEARELERIKIDNLTAAIARMGILAYEACADAATATKEFSKAVANMEIAIGKDK